jgi:nucleoside-diphosphate-sugar epimerase
MTNKKIVVTGAAGLVGQNLIIQLKEAGFKSIVGIDKHVNNSKILRQLHPDIQVIIADIAQAGGWAEALAGADIAIMLHAQIGAKDSKLFLDNNVTATRVMLQQIKQHRIPYVIHVSSSVVESVAKDEYTNTKKLQEQLVVDSAVDYCILRPTLMFGWFDRKHLGWLSRFMQRIPVFPIPRDGKFMRQPLYARDFCKIITSCVTLCPSRQIYNITGQEKIYYIDMIKKIKQAIGAKTLVLTIPYWLFWLLLKVYAMFSSDPPFTVEQLKALTAGDEFELIEWWKIFNITPTSLHDAIHETFTDPTYSKIVLEF